MEARGRGRARGRARGGQQGGPGGPGQPAGPAGPGQQQAPARPGTQQAWSRPPVPQQSTQQQSQWVRPQGQAPPPSSVGRGYRVATETPEASGHGDAAGALGGPGEGAAAMARGGGGGNGVRGRGVTFRSEIIRTKPSHITCKQGQSGTPIALTANYFSLLQAGKWGLNQYQVDFNPSIDQTRDRKRLLREALLDIGIPGYLFDGTNMYTPHRLHPDPLDKFVQNNEENVKVTVRLVGDVSWGDRHYIQLFNIIIRKCLTFMKFHLVGRDYYDPQNKIPVHEHKLELWPGYFTSIRQHENNILMACDVTFKVMRQDNCYDLLLECRSGNPQREFQSKVIGSVVMASYSNRTYRVDDVDFKTTPLTTFKMKDGSECSYVEYYKKKYNIQIQVTSQPMIVSRSKPREIRAGMPETVYLVPELCQLTGLTDRQRENFQLMRALADHTRVGPPQRMQKLKEFSDRLNRCPEAIQELKRWDLKFSSDLVKFQGRVLQPEKIIGGNNQSYSAGPQADWTRDLRSLPMYDSGKLNKLAVVCPVKFKQGCQDFIQCLQRAARGMSWDIGQPKIFDIHDDRSQTYLEMIEGLISKVRPDMIMCIVPNNSADRYSAIKKKCCVDRGIPTQVIVAKNMTSKGVMSIATKVAIQLNCKVGGAPWTITMPLSNIMIVGYDVCRDTVRKSKTFAGMVASLNKGITRYYNHTSEHEHEEELSENFATFLAMACKKFKDLNGRFPERILIYRDGVGEGQLPYVYEQEVETIKKKLQSEIYKDEKMMMAFIVVSKRINTRIFGDRGNPPPGTVVDDIVTLPERYDFFVVSQCVRQGTVAPTSYNVLSDNLGLPPDRMQMLAYKLCHMYYNWSGTVRVPAPCQYAHKLAFLTAQSLHRPANRELESLLYYL